MSNTDENHGKIIKLPLQSGLFIIRHGVYSNLAWQKKKKKLILCATPESQVFLHLFIFSLEISYILTSECPGWLNRTRKAKAEMLPLMPNTWCRFGGDCTSGTALPLPQSKKVPEVFPLRSVPVFVSPLLGHTSIRPVTKLAPVLGLGR